MKKIFFIFIILLAILSCGNSKKQEKIRTFEKKSPGLSENELSEYTNRLRNFLKTNKDQVNQQDLLNENGTPKITCSQKDILLEALLTSPDAVTNGNPIPLVAGMLYAQQLKIINDAACYNSDGTITAPKKETDTTEQATSNPSEYENQNTSENSDSTSSTNKNTNDLDLEDLNNLKHEVMDNGNESAFNKYSKYQLKILRNMMFAERGFAFKKGGEMRTYFENKSWYLPTIEDQSEIQLNDYDKEFVLKLKKHEGIN